MAGGMAAAKVIRARAPGVVALLVVTTCLVVLAATAASARPLKLSAEGDDCAHTVESSPAGDIQTVVGTAEGDGAAGGRGGDKFMMSVGMLGAIKGSGPSPGAGH